MIYRKHVPGILLSAALLLSYCGLIPATALAEPLRLRRVDWPSDAGPQAAETQAAAQTASIPIGGFHPLIAQVLTDARLSDADFFHVLEPALTGSVLSGSAASNYAIAVFDLGAVLHLTGYCEAQTLGLAGGLVTQNVVPLVGAGGTVEALASFPIGVFVDGLDAIDPGTGLLDSSGMIGHSNVSIAVGQSESCADGSELPTVIGTSLSAFYTTVIRNDQPISLSLGGDLYETPTVEFYQPGDPDIPTYPTHVTLQLLPAAGDAAYFPTLNFDTLEFEPEIPTALIGDSIGSLFFAGVNLSHNGFSVTGQLFMVDTGAEITVMSSFTGASLGVDPNTPDFTVDIEGIGGTTTGVPGFLIDTMEIVAFGGPMTFQNVPIVLFDVPSPEGGVLDGIIGTNLFVDRNLVIAGDLLSPFMEVSDPIVLPVPADLDGDGDVDGTDFLTFSNCFNGALQPPAPICLNPNADLDNDGDVDGTDFLTFSNCFNGALNPPACP